MKSMFSLIFQDKFHPHFQLDLFYLLFYFFFLRHFLITSSRHLIKTILQGLSMCSISFSLVYLYRCQCDVKRTATFLMLASRIKFEWQSYQRTCSYDISFPTCGETSIKVLPTCKFLNVLSLFG